MVRSLPPHVRRLIIEFDPYVSDGLSISDFCSTHGISRKTYYAIKKRFEQEGYKALHPRSSAPHRPATVYDDTTASVVLKIRERLARQGWDNGPQSIWYAMLDDVSIVPPIPSPSTIARILSAAGVVAKNPRKRPRSSMVRFQRAYAMELWQLDAFCYRLDASTMVTIYQLIDDATRFDVGTMCAARLENSHDALACVMKAIDTYGVPQQLLTDNGSAFNQIRRGRITMLHRLLAAKGCEAITGRVDHPQTQGKNERSHQTLVKFLDARHPDNLAQLQQLIAEFRHYYNHNRRHQALGGMTPHQAWDSVEHHPSNGQPISHEQLTAEINKYRTKRPDTAEDDPQDHPATHYIKQSSRPRIALDGYYISIPTRLSGKRYYLIHTDTEYALFDLTHGNMIMQIPLPINVPGEHTGATIPLWKVTGAQLDQPPQWFRQRQQQWQQQHHTNPPEIAT